MVGGSQLEDRSTAAGWPGSRKLDKISTCVWFLFKVPHLLLCNKSDYKLSNYINWDKQLIFWSCHWWSVHGSVTLIGAVASCKILVWSAECESGCPSKHFIMLKALHLWAMTLNESHVSNCQELAAGWWFLACYSGFLPPPKPSWHILKWPWLLWELRMFNHSNQTK